MTSQLVQSKSERVSSHEGRIVDHTFAINKTKMNCWTMFLAAHNLESQGSEMEGPSRMEGRIPNEGCKL